MTDTPNTPYEPPTVTETSTAVDKAPDDDNSAPDDGKTWAETLHEQTYGDDYDNDKDIKVPEVATPQVEGTISAPGETAGNSPSA